MRKRRLKGYVLPTLYLMITICVFTSIILLGNSIKLDNSSYDYSIDSLKDRVESVIVEDTIASSNIEKPVSDTVNIKYHFYSKDSNEEKQQESLIYFENTYIPNTGVIYSSNEEFEVKAIFNGKITDIIDDEFFGKCIVVEHQDNLRSYYYGLDNITVEEGMSLETGAILGISKQNTIINNAKSFLLEIYYNNELIDPEKVYGTKITDYE